MLYFEDMFHRQTIKLKFWEINESNIENRDCLGGKNGILRK